LAAFGLLAFGARQLRSVPGYSPPVKFRVAIISVVRADDPAIVRLTEAAARQRSEDTRRVECNLMLRAPRSDDCASGLARTARSDAVRRFGTGVASRRAGV
jgi:hypothetical protein